MAIMRVSSVPRIHRPSRTEFHEQYVLPQRPVILTGVLDDWPCSGRWSPEYFASTFGDHRVKVEIQESQEPITYFAKRKYLDTALATFVSMLDIESPIHYLSQWPILRDVSLLAREVGSLESFQVLPSYVPRALQHRLRLQPNFWFGPAGAFSTLHFDNADNLFAQVYGRKRFVLFAPDQRSYLYYPWTETQLIHFSPVDIANPDLKRFPLFAQAQAMDCTLSPGDLLFLPAKWWHYVYACTTSISLSHWWYSRPISWQRLRDEPIRLRSVYHLYIRPRLRRARKMPRSAV